MNLHEYQAKQILRDVDIPMSYGWLARTPQDAHTIVSNYGQKVMLKAQVTVSNRMNHAGIEAANSPEEAYQIAENMLSITINSLRPHEILIEPFHKIAREYYIAFSYDRSHQRTLFMGSSQGGRNLRHDKKLMTQVHLHPLLGINRHEIIQIANGMELPYQYWSDFVKICNKLYKVYTEYDATLLEINPLVVTEDQQLIGLDCKLSIDDNALIRHHDLRELRDTRNRPESETLALKHNLSFIQFEGQVGCMVNGAGLAMATMDMINYYGRDLHVQAANFLDIGGGATAEHAANALRVIFTLPDIECVAINIFGGITRCDEIARGILQVIEQDHPSIPIILRMKGTNFEEACQMIDWSTYPNFIRVNTLTEIAQKAIEIVQSKGINHVNSG